MKMIVKNIKWISESAEEAEVEISDGEFTCVAFSQPCDRTIGETIDEPLHVFSMRDAMICENEPTVGIWNIENSGLSRRVVAKVTDTTQQLIAVGKINLVIEDHLPGGIEKDDLIEFNCGRIDLW
ncbi:MULTISPECIES: hypothetical protein [unclassified Pseudomonas]|uniref:hypothetical protein n=1 Tax=unclassified Pseudomonas TaxID=196821 RepID=UPI00111C0AA6|nr:MULTISPECIES: hypothetical protein [unclassified Pseudomonas]